MGDKHTYSQVPLESESESSPAVKPVQSNTKMPNAADPEKGEDKILQGKVKKWEVFPGRNKFCCDGRLMVSTQTGIFYFTLFLIIAASAGFFGNDSWYLWINVSPALPILAGVQCIFVCVVLCRTACGDPGVIPRASPAEAQALEKLIEQEQNAAASKSGNLPYRPPPRIREVTVNGRTFKLKYCYTCKIFRPPRASHCSVCDNCVDRFDHHCPWVGNCVGRRNYKYFFLFLASLTIYCAYLLSLSVTAIVLRTKASNFSTAMQKGPVSPVVALVAFFSIWSVAGLAGFHAYLSALNMTTNEDVGIKAKGFADGMSEGPVSPIVALIAFVSLWIVGGLAAFHVTLVYTETTTNEDIKGTFKESNGGNPFSKGSYCTNCAVVLCGPLPPSLIDRRGWVSEHDIPAVTTQPASQQSMRGPNPMSTGATTPVMAGPQANINRNNAVSDNFTASGSTSYSAQSNGNREPGLVSNGRPYPVQPKYLPPIEHHQPQSADKNPHSREYLT